MNCMKVLLLLNQIFYTFCDTDKLNFLMNNHNIQILWVECFIGEDMHSKFEFLQLINIFFFKFIRTIYMLKYLHIHATYYFIFRSVYIDFNIGIVSFVFLGRMPYVILCCILWIFIFVQMACDTLINYLLTYLLTYAEFWNFKHSKYTVFCTFLLHALVYWTKVCIWIAQDPTKICHSGSDACSCLVFLYLQYYWFKTETVQIQNIQRPWRRRRRHGQYSGMYYDFINNNVNNQMFRIEFSSTGFLVGFSCPKKKYLKSFPRGVVSLFQLIYPRSLS